ncbi:AraC family transcriptional regulator [Bacillus litorisediminis]|uniref:AraC family transcriptional regulator n=1 Tax=Bacillus litorisediminis TaxID=2922713 RepID=UPI001FAD2B09|nr:AraC family transcriptional regulator [Bacillus litorisediminis]
MGWVESIQKALNFIEDHLLEDISIEDIAKEANSSVFHFQRTFSILTDLTVGEYIRRRRLTLAAHELTLQKCKVIDVAYKYGYDTPEAFTKAFRRQHGISPSEVRTYRGKLKSYNRLMIQVSLKGAEPMQVKILEKDKFKVVGVKREFSLENEENLKGIPLMWDEVHRNGTNDRLAKLNNGEIRGILGVCVVTKEPMMDYWIAADFNGDTPEGLLELEIPASKWAVFEVHGPMPDAMQKVWKQIFTEWFPSSGYEFAGTPELEVYPYENPTDPNYYSEIWIPVK